MKPRRYLLLTAAACFACILSGDAALAQYSKADSAKVFSLINKAEDFTRQQDYIRRSSELLKIDELNRLLQKSTSKIRGNLWGDRLQ